MWLIADLVYLLAGLVYLPVLLYQMVFVGKNRRGWSERLGFVRAFASDRSRIWIHAVSLGEINATPRLVDALRERCGDVDIVVSTTTDTGFARAVQLYGREKVFRFPLDFRLVVSRVLRRVRPSLIVLVEQEVWYNLVRLARRRGIPVAVVNGRLTDRSARRLRRLGSLARSMFRDLTWVGAQDETIASRFRELGVPSARVVVTSSMKWDSAAVCDHVDGADALARAMGIASSRTLWVCGSTGPGEEAIVLDAYERLLRTWRGAARSVQCGSLTGGDVAAPLLAIVPRKPERFDEVARLIARVGFDCLRRSEHTAGSAPPVGDSSVILGDTMGELRKFYSLAGVVFVGRSLVPMGGSDPMEVAALGKPIVVGPHTDNFELPIDALQGRGAVRVVESAESLASVVATILRDEGGRAVELGRCAREVVRDHQGATQRTADALVNLLDGDEGGADVADELVSAVDVDDTST